MEPQLHLNAFAIVTAALSSFIIGTLWHVFLFKQINQSKKDPVTAQSVSQCLISISIRLVGTFLMAFVFSHNIAAWDPRSWGYEEAFVPPFIAAMMSALFTWVGFYIPQDLHRISMDGKSWKVFFSDTLGNLLTLIVSALILVYWK